mgnify:CR=1 FL=1
MSKLFDVFNQIKITTKIYASFAIMLVLLGSISFFSINGTGIIRDLFKDYREVSRATLVENAFLEDVLEARLAVMKYRIDNKDEYAKEVNENIQEIIDDKAKALEVIDDTESLEILEALLADAKQYREIFVKAEMLEKNKNEILQKIDTLGLRMQNNLSELRKQAYESRNIGGAYYAASVLEPVMLAKYHAGRFFFKNDDESYNRALSEIDRSAKEADILLRSISNPDQFRMAQQIQDDIESYRSLFGEAVGVVQSRNDLFINGLDVIGPKMNAELEVMVDNAVATQNALGPRAEAQMQETVGSTLSIAVLCGVLGIVFAFVIGHTLSGSISRVTKNMSELANGNLDLQIDGTDRKDEIGDMARALQVFKDNAVERKKMQEKEEERQKEQIERAERLEKSVQEFEHHVESMIGSLSSASSEMQATASQMAASVEETGNQSNAVVHAATQANTNVQTVASASEELSAAIHQVAKTVTASADFARNCSQNAENSQKELEALQKAISEIDEVVNAITDVAEQTNLLALNATIEAARAGDAGKGFAVVASEVKSLALQTHNMTEEITNKVRSVKESARNTVQSLLVIIDQIQQITQSATDIASSIDEQSSSTSEISRNAQQAATGTDEVTDNVKNIQQAANESSQAASYVKQAADDLASQASDLKKNVDSFLAEVKAA